MRPPNVDRVMVELWRWELFKKMLSVFYVCLFMYGYLFAYPCLSRVCYMHVSVSFREHVGICVYTVQLACVSTL